MGRLAGMKGGGFLNNVDATLVDYEFTNAFPGEKPGDDPELFAVISFRPDGGDVVQTTLRGGSALYLTITDPHTIINPEGGPARIWDKSDLYHFLESIETGGVADGGIDPSQPDSLSFKSLIGYRFRLVQQDDTGRMEARRKAGKNPKRVDEKTGKEYSFTRLVAEQVYDKVAVAAPVKPAGRGKTVAAAKVVAKPVAKDGGQVADLEGETIAVLTKVIGDNGGEVMRSDLTRLMTTELLATKNPRREAIRKLAYTAEFLKQLEVVAFDEVAQTIALA